ncbi:DUF6461 domain-containing protein [Streptomyces sp. NPDC004539]|uniref:DUF6461 domain-containing protein n=1 Tax=Streptomyces sp. NPDC004539 TaxID=3154280 RepID=UPI0033BAC464
MTTTATAYTWFEERFPDLAEAYCFTLVHDLSPADLLHRLGGTNEPALTGADEFVEAAFEFSDRYDGKRQLVAMTTVGSWTLMIEANGYLGVTEERALDASAGTRWVSHFVNVNALDAFLWAEDSAPRLTFEPMYPDHRWGSTPDELLAVMRDIGFHFGDDIPELDLSASAAFALAEHLTGVAVTPELLESTTFTCGGVAVR